MANETITLAGGCFWCIESAFNSVEGVVNAYSGYANGDTSEPTYEAVCSGNTGYTEAVQVTFDDSVISRREILEIFFALHDPTQLNRQGNDIGSQYRGGIYYTSEEQHQDALKIVDEIKEAKIWPNEVVTEIEPLEKYFQAEDYHQDYFSNNPQNTYCNMVVAPKLAKFKKTFASRLKS
jgi:peptide-methionine (S)-S-oxide reductase